MMLKQFIKLFSFFLLGCQNLVVVVDVSWNILLLMLDMLYLFIDKLI
jgi:hypothetical protein